MLVKLSGCVVSAKIMFILINSLDPLEREMHEMFWIRLIQVLRL